MNVREAEVAARVAIRELLMVEAQEMEDRGMEVVHVNSVDCRGESELVGGAVHMAAANTTAGQPHRETVMIMVAARESRQLGDGCTAELTAPEYQHLFEQPALFQIGQESGDGLVPFAGELAMVATSGFRGRPRAVRPRSRPG